MLATQKKQVNTRSKVIFLHIPKTAGTTFYDCLKQIYGKKSIVEIHGRIENSIDSFKNDIYEPRKKNISCIKGHMSFGLHNFVEEPTTYITFVRNPISRTISLYNYLLRSGKKHSQYNLVDNKTLEEFVISNTFHNNGQSRFLSGKMGEKVNNAEMLDLAKTNIDNCFSVVGLTEKFDESLLLLKSELNWQKIPVYTKENVIKKNSNNTVSEKTLDIIKEYNQTDLELYKYAEEKFQQQIIAYKGNINEDLEKFKTLNQTYSPLGKVYSECRSTYINFKNKKNRLV